MTFSIVCFIIAVVIKLKLFNNVRRLRFENNEMTQQELADMIGVTRMTVYSIEKGRYVPSTVLALKIARVFNRPVEEIFYFETSSERNGNYEE